MANPTTYNQWVLPTGTDLVTGLPTQIATMADAIDLSFRNAEILLLMGARY